MTSVARGSPSSHRSGILFVDPSMEYTVYRENLRLHVHETSEVIHEWYSIHGWSSVSQYFSLDKLIQSSPVMHHNHPIYKTLDQS
jgi:hypothetical protein